MTDQDDLDGPVARQLARTLQAVAAATPVADRRDAIESLLPPSGAEPVAAVEPVAPARRSGHRRTVTALAVAAVVLVVVALAAVAIGRGDDGAVDLRPAEEPDLDTGWYLPGDGWTVTAATTERLFEGEGVCPCTSLIASEVGDDPAALVVWETARAGYADVDAEADGEPVEVGGRPGYVLRPATDGVEVPGYEPDDDDTVDTVVATGGRRLTAMSSGVGQEVILDVLDSWADRIDAGEPVRREDLLLPEGMEASRPQTKTWSFDHEVLVTVTNDATGEAVSYRLAPTVSYVAIEAVLASDRTTFDDDVFTVVSHAGRDDLFSRTRIGAPVDVVAGVHLLGGPEVDDDVITALGESLHEVDTAAWRAALSQIDPAVDPALLSAPTLFDPPLTG